MQISVPDAPTVARDPELFASVFLKVLNKKSVIVPFLWNKAQRHFHEHRTGKDLILKSRQLGFSTYLQGEMYRRTVTSTRSTMTLAHDADTTTKLRIMADRFWENCRFGDIQPQRKYANASLTTYPELESVATIATAGTLETGRGGTYTDFHGSEVAFWKDAEKIVAGAMQGGSPDIALESTPNGAQGFFYNKCMQSIAGEGPWKLHFYPWWWDEEYKIELAEGEVIVYEPDEEKLVREHNLSPEQIKWRRSKQMELGRLFPQEYPEDPITCFLTSGEGYFGDLSGVFVAPPNVAYVHGHKYAAGLDFGQSGDYTAMPVLDFTTKTQVDLLHIRGREWSEIRKNIARVYKKWHLDVVLAENNSIGAVNIEALRKMGLNIRPFNTTNLSKGGLMSELNEALHFGGWKLQDYMVQRNELNSFVATQLPITGIWRLAASGEAHDDTVIGLGLALNAGKYAVSDEEMERYGKGEATAADIDDDMIEYHAMNHNMTFEEARVDLLKEVTLQEAMANIGRNLNG